MRGSARPLHICLVSLLTLAFGIAPSVAQPDAAPQFGMVTPAPTAGTASQQFNAVGDVRESDSLDMLLTLNELAHSPHGYDVEAAIAQARSEIGTSRPTGWSAPGECIMSVIRWVEGAGGANWIGGGDPVSNYTGATRLTIEHALPGDIVQYEHLDYPTSWVSGVHTLLVVGVNDDGTFDIIQSNIPGGSGLVTEETHWLPDPPAGFQAVVWRF